MKIFIGTRNITDAPRILQKGFAALGMQADIALIRADSVFYNSIDSVVDVLKFYRDAVINMQKNGMAYVKPNREFIQFVKQYDIFIFIASSSLLPRLTDLPILQAMGKTIVCYQTGSEVRHEITSVPFWSAYGHSFPKNNFITHEKHCSVQNMNGVVKALFDSSSFTHSLLNKTYNMRMAEKYGTTICTHPSIPSCAIRPHMRIALPLDGELCNFKPPKNQIPLVVHAPSKRHFKRSDLIISTLGELAEEGVKFKLKFIEGMKNTELLNLLNQADVLVDQVACGCLGRLALEGLASGCAVVSGNSACVPWPPDRPAVSVTPINLKDRLREVLTNKKLRLDLAAQGYEYIRKGYHSPENAAQNILDAISNEKNKKFDYYPTIFTEIARKIPNEPLPQFLKEMTLDVLKTHGTSPLTELSCLEQEGFVPQESAQINIPRWDMSKLHKIGPWNWCGKHIPVPNFDIEHSYNCNVEVE